jgi:periplasmic copper chaperone A
MLRITIASALTLALGLGPALAHDPEDSKDAFMAGALRIAQPWSRATPGGAKVAGGYMTITNTGTEPDRLVGGTLPRAGRFEVHEMKTENGVMTMRPLAQGLEIKPGATVTLAPGGYHVMFMDLKQPLTQGESIEGELRFEKAGTVMVRYTVQGIGATSGAAASSGAPTDGGAAGGHHHH